MSTQYWSASTILRIPLRWPSMVARRFRICFLSLCIGHSLHGLPHGRGLEQKYRSWRACASIPSPPGVRTGLARRRGDLDHAPHAATLERGDIDDQRCTLVAWVVVLLHLRRQLIHPLADLRAGLDVPTPLHDQRRAHLA